MKFLAQIQKSEQLLYSGFKSGIFRATIQEYGRLDVRGKGEVKKEIETDHGTLYVPGPRGMPIPKFKIQKGLNQNYQRELEEIITLLQKMNFKRKELSPREVVMERGNIVVNLNYETKKEELAFISSLWGFLFSPSVRYLGEKAILGYQIVAKGELNEEEKTLVEGIHSRLRKEYKFH